MLPRGSAGGDHLTSISSLFRATAVTFWGAVGIRPGVVGMVTGATELVDIVEVLRDVGMTSPGGRKTVLITVHWSNYITKCKQTNWKTIYAWF